MKSILDQRPEFRIRPEPRRFQATRTIGILQPPGSLNLSRLLAGLGEWRGVEFRSLTTAEVEGVDGLIVISAKPAADFNRWATSEIPVMVVAAESAVGAMADGEEVRFSLADSVDSSLRGVSLPEPGGVRPTPADETSGSTVLASKGSRPAWLRRAGELHTVDLVLCPPPSVDGRGFLHDHFSRYRFLALLPWLDFLQRVCGPETWPSGPRQACIVFDDPSLYRPGYGYLDFAGLADHAALHRYHVGIATVPIDLALASRRTVAIFRERKQHLSLLVHGNNHLSQELARRRTDQEQLQLYGEVTRRIRRFETRHGLPVGRVMEAPHAAFASGSFPALFRLGFEAAMVTPEKLAGSAPDHAWPPDFGLVSDGDFFGLPWVPRIRLRKGWRTEVLLAAYLHQPLVIAGHHQDAAEGMGFLEEMAATINGLGDVHWQPMHELVRRRARRRIEGDTLFVRTFARQASVSVPTGIRKVVVECLGGCPDEPENRTVEEGDKTIATIRSSEPVLGPIAVRAPGELTLRRTSARSIDAAEVPAPPRRYWPMFRKMITETRDRMQATLRPVSGRRAKTSRVPVSVSEVDLAR